MQSQERDLTRTLNNSNLAGDDLEDKIEEQVTLPRRRVARTVRRITLDLDQVQRHNDRMKKFNRNDR